MQFCSVEYTAFYCTVGVGTLLVRLGWSTVSSSGVRLSGRPGVMRVTWGVCKGAAALCARGTSAPSHREALNKYGQYHPSVMSIQKFIDFGKTHFYLIFEGQ